MERAYSDFLKAVASGGVVEVTIEGDNLAWRDQSGSIYSSTRPYHPELIRTLTDHNVSITVVPEDRDTPWLGLLLNWFPMILLIAVLIFFNRRMRATGFGMFDRGQGQRELTAKVDEINAHLRRIEGILIEASRQTTPPADHAKSDPGKPEGAAA
jgi:cell division protease FtsH